MVKAKVVQRLVNESSYYKKETDENTAKLEQMKADGKDEYDIKKFAEVLEESVMMIPDSENRKNAAVEDLRRSPLAADGASAEQLADPRRLDFPRHDLVGDHVA